ncbi:NAD(P)H-binding protein [Streptomyces rectiviolaceus]|uniref:NAD(P)H-binding protein n=1 Tax=Streptomyces rectiviolaceus TaxID=332591 RepID=UPI003631F3CB
MIAVTGATGTVGGHVARLLSTDHPTRLLGRSLSRLRALVPGADVVSADFADRRSLERALDGARALFAVTANPLEPAHDANLLAAARTAGVEHVVKLSALAVTDDRADDLITNWQRENEDRIRASGLAWTMLRPRSFMSNTLSWAGSIRAHNTVVTPQPQSRNASIDPRDIAEVAVLSLTGPGHEQQEYALTGPEAISPAEQCEHLSQVLARPLRCDEIPSSVPTPRGRSTIPNPSRRPCWKAPAARALEPSRAWTSPSTSFWGARPPRTGPGPQITRIASAELPGPSPEHIERGRTCCDGTPKW